ncbi:MAG TPA: phosphatase PAP2 family protein [Bacteroidales bacterium]|nr:phosphatase PAP2 family protein [Bacteroidales bacterium]
MKRFLLLVVILITPFLAYSQGDSNIENPVVADTLPANTTLYKINDSVAYLIEKPTPFRYIPYAGRDLWEGPKQLFRKESILPVAGVTASTLILIAFDEKITARVQQFCRWINLSPSNNAKNISPVEGVPFWVPTDLSSGLYYIGDGITECSINAGFYIYGLVKKDNRALRTAAQLSEGLISVGIMVQILKHVSGRATAYANNGKDMWRWFPSPSRYTKSVPWYDAFPSGHLAIAMTTVTIISSNYPEKRWIKPVGYSLMGLCGFQMINNGVHWAGDYPLAILMGYGFGKLISSRGKTEIKYKDFPELQARYNNRPKLKLSPTYLYNSVPALSLSLKF